MSDLTDLARQGGQGFQWGWAMANLLNELQRGPEAHYTSMPGDEAFVSTARAQAALFGYDMTVEATHRTGGAPIEGQTFASFKRAPKRPTLSLAFSKPE